MSVRMHLGELQHSVLCDGPCVRLVAWGSPSDAISKIDNIAPTTSRATSRVGAASKNRADNDIGRLILLHKTTTES